MFLSSVLWNGKDASGNWLCNARLASSGHAGGIICGMGDATAKFISAKIDPHMWFYGLTPAGKDAFTPTE
jgi:hypothetical protein